MTQQYCRNLHPGPNDEMFVETKETFQQTTSDYYDRQYPDKMIRSSELINYIKYPIHPIFRSRVDLRSWCVFITDLDESLFQSAPAGDDPCSCCTPARRSSDDLYKILAHYNKVLFHPMLIDAQVFVRALRVSAKHSEHVTTISFLIARDAAHFRSFLRPVVGRSSGYTISVRPGNYTQPINFHLNPMPIVPEGVPAETPAFTPLNVLDPVRIERCLTQYGASYNSRHLLSAMPNYSVYQDWVDFFEFRTNEMPTSGPFGQVIAVPKMQGERMRAAPTQAAAPMSAGGYGGAQAAPAMVFVGGVPSQPTYAAAPQMVQASYQPVPNSAGAPQMVPIGGPYAQSAYAAAPQMVPVPYQPVPTSGGMPQMVPLPHQPAAYYPPTAYQPVGGAPAVQMVPVPSVDQTMKR